MFVPFYVALAVATLFYILLPVIGGYIARNQWRRFRERLLDLALSPRLHLGSWAAACESGQLQGHYRFHGEIEAVEGEDKIWLHGRDLTAVVDLSSTWFHILPDEGRGEALEGRYALVERMRWQRVRVFPESSRVFVGGRVRVEDGIPVFFNDAREPLIVVSYEGNEANLLSRLIAGGRVQNEYWNPLSRASLAFGMGTLGIFFAFVGSHLLPTILFLSLLVSLAPVLSLLPPGLLFFFLYRRFWRKALDERVLRDLCRLPLRFSRAADGSPAPQAGDAPLPEGGFYRVRRGDIPAGDIATFVPWAGDKGPWTIFTPESTDDPEIRRIAVAGDPIALARRSERRALTATLLSGVFLVAAFMINLITAILLWRNT
ncbi:MAG TPA: hypothetical protein VMV83_17620 [Rectinemataceae bacterium]|nr:hypothetical protein [Rectinemataceae bacterium]